MEYIQKPKNQRRDADLNVKRAHVKQKRLKNRELWGLESYGDVMGTRELWGTKEVEKRDPKIESYGDVTLDFRELWGLLRSSDIL